MRILPLLALLATVPPSLRAQQELWQLFGPYDNWYHALSPFGDFDKDGQRDLLVTLLPTPPFGIAAARILSGSDSAVLWEGIIYPTDPVQDGGDIDGDGYSDLVMHYSGGLTNSIHAWSTRTNQPIWDLWFGQNVGSVLLGNIDTNGDGRPDLVTLKRGTQSEVYVFDHTGALRYALPLFAFALEAISLANMGDMDGDGAEDFLVGCNDYGNGGAGLAVLISGQTGTPIRFSQGLLAGDKTNFQATNLGDIDGDGVNDYACFPWWSASRLMPCLWSGATGALIRALPGIYTECVIADQDLDLDGVNDLVLGWEYPISPPQLYGRSQAISGRDGTELWAVENFPGSGQPSSGWAFYGAGLGVQADSPYPTFSWMDLGFRNLSLGLGAAEGRVRAFRATPAGQGPVLGTPCTSDGTLPQIGVRKTAAGSRVTIAKSHPNAFAALWLSIDPLPAPVDLSPFGMSGCSLYVSADAAWLRTLGTTGIDRGYAAVDLPFQLSASGTGLGVKAQWLVVDPASGNHAATAMHALRLQ